MSRIKSRIVDRNRYEKKYPVVRVPKKPSFLGDSNLEVEVLTVNFENQDSKDVFFGVKYENTDFRILLSPRDTTAEDSAQVTLAIDDALTDTSKTRIEASAPFTGIVDVVIIRVTR